MSTNLTLTPEPEVAAVLLEVTGAPAGPLEITRTDANGVAPVRLLPGQEPIGGALTVRDYEAALSGPIQYELVGDRTNELPNPSFEVDLTGWSMGDAGATFTRSTTLAFRGSASGLLTTGAGGSAFLSRGPGFAVPATPGDTYTISCYARGTGALTLRVRNDTVGTIAGSPKATMDPALWKRLVVTGTLPAGATSVEPQAVLDPSGSVHLDAFMVEKTDQERPYIDAGPTPATITATTTLDVAAPVLHAAVLPHLRQSLELITGYDSRRESGGQVHHVEGREDAIVVTKPMRLREGSVTLHASTFEQARAIEDIAAPGEVLMLRQPDNAGMDMYFIARSVGSRPKQENTTPKRWSVDLDYVEQRSPSGPLAGAAGWNFAEHTALGLTFAQSLVAFPTFNDRVAGP